LADADIRIDIATNAETVARDLGQLSRSIRGISNSASSGVGPANRQLSQLGDTSLAASKNVNALPRAFDLTGRSAREASQPVRQLQQSTSDLARPAIRYALYDLSNTFRDVAAAAAAFSIVPIGLSIQYEREFANVVRTNELAGASVKQLRDDLLASLRDIAQSTPIDWTEITNIAALAGQLGIAQERIADFTETVAQISATTDLTVDAAAEAFGRLDQLLSTVNGNFEALGSALLAVGVDSVAAESEIVNVSTQIASMGELAGLTAPEIIGLSGAIASLGIRPELARGTITRLFSNIGRSAIEGGASVEEFGRLTGRTAEQFVDDWGTDPGAVLQDFFDGINQEGPEAERTLRNLGITSVRDIPSILRLAQSSDEVRRLIKLSREEFLLAGKVTEQYGIISTTTAEQLQRLVQNFQNLGAVVGDTVGPLSVLFQFLNQAVIGFTRLVENPVGGFLAGVVVVIGVLAAALAGVIAAVGLLAAGFSAVSFSLRELGLEFNRATIAALKSKAAMDAYAASNARAAATIRLLGKGLRGLGIIGLVVTGITLLSAAIGTFTNETDKSSENVQRFFGDLKGLETVLRQDTEAFDQATGKFADGSEALAVYRREVKETKDELDAGQAAENFAKGQEGIEEATRKANEELREQQTLVAGQQTLDYFQTALLADPEIESAFADPAFQQIFTEAGGNVSELLTAGLEGQGAEYLRAVAEEIGANRDVLQREYNALALRINPFTSSEEDRQRFRELRGEIAEQDRILGVVNGSLADFAQGQDDAVAAVERSADAQEFANSQTDESSRKLALQDEELRNVNNDLFQQAEYADSVATSFGNYSNALAEGADNANTAAGAIGDVIQQILAQPEGDVDVILGNLAVLLQFLESQGPQTAAAQELVRSAIQRVGAEAGEQTPKVAAYNAVQEGLADFDIESFAAIFQESMANVGSSASGAAEEVKTLEEQFSELLDTIFDPINAAQAQAEAIFDLGKAYAEAGRDALFASDEIEDAVRSITAAAESPEQAIGNLQVLFQQLARTVGSETDPSLQFLSQTIALLAAEFGVAIDQATAFANVDFSNFQRGIESVQEEVVTLLDYAGDLDDVISRAFDIRYAELLQVDRIASAWEDFANEIDQARQNIEELRAAQRDLAADRAIKEYFLSVAEAYDDDLRAATLRDELADIDRERAENARQLRQEELIAGAVATGDAAPARENRAALLDLVGEYQDYIVTLAEAGASQDELRAATDRARREFVEQARELGFQESVIQDYAQAFDDVTFAINRVPRNVTIEADVNPALTALRELQSQLETNIQRAREMNAALNRPTPTPDRDPDPDPDPGPSREAQLRADVARLQGRVNNIRGSISNVQLQMRQPGIDRGRYESLSSQLGSLIRQLSSANSNLSEAQRRLQNYDVGGFTGRGGRLDPAGIVHRGEYVVPKHMVDQSRGLPSAQFLAQMQAMQGYQAGGFVGGATGVSFPDAMMVELSPYDRQLLENAGNVQLRLDGRVVAQAANRNSVSASQRGSN